jgi:undecaprenyl diphosphate synthase
VHVAIIMDGNLAWAAQHGLPAKAAHTAAARSIHAAVEMAAHADVTTLTLYALSPEDWEPAFAAQITPLLRRYLIAAGSRMHLRVIFDCLLHDSLVRAAMCPDPAARLDPEEFYRELTKLEAYTPSAGAVDLLIRTGYGRNLSDFMLWETAHADLVSMRFHWPDFDEALFNQALQEHRLRGP